MIKSSVFLLLLGSLFILPTFAQDANKEVDLSYKEKAYQLIQDAYKIQTEDPAKGIKYIDQAIVIALKKKDSTLLFEVQIDQANYYSYGGKFERAEEMYKELVKAIPQRADLEAKHKGILFNDYGTFFLQRGNFKEAIDYLSKSYSIRDSINDPRLGQTLSNIAIAYINIGEFSRALKHIEEAIILQKKAGNQLGVIKALNQKAIVFDLQGQHEEALAIFEDILERTKALNNIPLVGMTYNNIGQAHQKLKNYPKAIKAFEARNEIAKQTNRYDFLAGGLMNIANSYSYLGDRKKAERNYEQALQISREKGLNEFEKKVLFDIKDYYENIGDYKNALNYWKQYNHLRDSLFEVRNEAELNEIRTKYETNKAERKAEVLEKENELSEVKLIAANRQRWLWTGIAALFVVLSFSFFLMYRYRVKTNKQLTELNATKDKLFSIIAHDLKNPLSAFRSITQSLSEDIFDIEKEDLAYFINSLNTTAGNLLELLQNLLYWAISQSGRLEFSPQTLVLKENTQETLNILQTNIDKKQLTVENNIEETVSVYADSKMTATIIRNLVANAIKFTPEGGKISITTQQNSQNQVRVTVSDNGIGISAEDQRNLFNIKADRSKRNEVKGKGTGLGLILCKELVEQQGGTIWVESELNKGTTFYFTLPQQA